MSTTPSLPAGQRPQHTPGDWRASAPDGTYHDVIRIFAADDPEGALPVAVCPQRQSAILSVLSGQTNETTEAACNARLISHAPALLEALRDFHALWNALPREYKLPQHDEWYALVTNARALLRAVEKADG